MMIADNVTRAGETVAAVAVRLRGVRGEAGAVEAMLDATPALADLPAALPALLTLSAPAVDTARAVVSVKFW